MRLIQTKKTQEKSAFVQSNKQTYYKSKTFKANEIKIKKILKQPIEKKIYKVKDYVVYPKHGVGKIVSIEKAKIGNIDIQPCGGTHVQSTKEIGKIIIGKIENKGKMNRRVNLSLND